MELCSQGNLMDFYRKNPREKFTWVLKRNVALDAARAVNYLHKQNPVVLHRDLKSLNLFLDDDFRCKLGDFGWSRTIVEGEYLTKGIGTHHWMPPEVITST